MPDKKQKEPTEYEKKCAFDSGRHAKQYGFARLNQYKNDLVEPYFFAGFDGVEFPQE